MKVKKTAIVYHKSDLDGVVSAAIATMYENSKDRDVVYIPYSYEDDVKKVTSKVRDLDVVYVLDVSFGADSKTVFKKWLDEGKSLIHHIHLNPHICQVCSERIPRSGFYKRSIKIKQ